MPLVGCIWLGQPCGTNTSKCLYLLSAPCLQHSQHFSPLPCPVSLAQQLGRPCGTNISDCLTVTSTLDSLPGSGPRYGTWQLIGSGSNPLGQDRRMLAATGLVDGLLLTWEESQVRCSVVYG